MGTNRLSDRLKALEADGVIAKATLPPPGEAHVYVLTDLGERLRQPVVSLAQWGAGLPLDERHDPGTAASRLARPRPLRHRPARADPRRPRDLRFHDRRRSGSTSSSTRTARPRDRGPRPSAPTSPSTATCRHCCCSTPAPSPPLAPDANATRRSTVPPAPSNGRSRSCGDGPDQASTGQIARRGRPGSNAMGIARQQERHSDPPNEDFAPKAGLSQKPKGQRTFLSRPKPAGGTAGAGAPVRRKAGASSTTERMAEAIAVDPSESLLIKNRIVAISMGVVSAGRRECSRPGAYARAAGLVGCAMTRLRSSRWVCSARGCPPLARQS